MQLGKENVISSLFLHLCEPLAYSIDCPAWCLVRLSPTSPHPAHLINNPQSPASFSQHSKVSATDGYN